MPVILFAVPPDGVAVAVYDTRNVAAGFKGAAELVVGRGAFKC